MPLRGYDRVVDQTDQSLSQIGRQTIDINLRVDAIQIVDENSSNQESSYDISIGKEGNRQD
jgi:hypothetical protein